MANQLAARNMPALNNNAAVRPQAPIIANGQPVVGGVR